MWKLVSNLSASSKVVIDKTYDYMGYYMNWQNNNKESENILQLESDNNDIIPENENSNDSLKDYETFLEIQKYRNEKNNKRILPEVGFLQEYWTFFDKPTHIIDNIYLGSAFNAASYEVLKDFDIKVIFNITREISNYYPEDFEYIRCDIYDNNKHSILRYLKTIYNHILFHQHHTTGNILIHCYMGASRSASVVIYYLMKKIKNVNGEYLSFDEALDLLKRKRTIVNPTFRFTKDLAKSILK